MFDGRFRSSVDKGVGPIGSALGKTGLSPDHLTALGLFLAVPAAIAIGAGHLRFGLVLLIASAVPDLLDGALAKASGTASKRGAFFDSVADRVTDALIMGGVAWFLQTSRHGHTAILPFGILAVSTLISYERAKAESLGFIAKGGLMERAERIILLCIGLVAPVILVPILWAMLILTSITAVQRFAKVWRQATDAAATEPVLPDGPPGGVPGPAAGGSAPVGSSTGWPNRTTLTGAPGARVPTGGVPGGGVPAGAGPSGGVAPDPNAAMAERWRAWRQQTAARQGGSRMAPATRPARSGHETDGSRRATRWEERRAARLQADSEVSERKSAFRAPGGRHGTRRP